MIAARRLPWLIVLAGVALAGLPASGGDAARLPDRPEDRILDGTGRLDRTMTHAALRETTAELARDTGVELFVVVYTDPAEYDALFEEDLGARLRDHWALNPVDILMLVDEDDETVTILLGPQRDPHEGRTVERILKRLIYPHFRNGFFMEGLRSGVAGLAALVRDEPLPKRRTWWRSAGLWKVFLAVSLVGVVLNLVYRYRRSVWYVAVPYLGAGLFWAEYLMQSGNGGGGGFGGMGCSAGCGGCGGCAGA